MPLDPSMLLHLDASLAVRKCHLGVAIPRDCQPEQGGKSKVLSGTGVPETPG